MILTVVIGFLTGGLLLFLLMKSKNVALSSTLKMQNDLMKNANDQLSDLNARLVSVQTENASLRTENGALQKEIELLNKQIEREANEREKAFSMQLQMVKNQLNNATETFLKQREESLTKTNISQMDAVINPLKETIGEMRKSMLESIKTSVENKASMEKAIEGLLLRSAEIGKDANNLANALKNESKTQGNWGELILEKILENSGLKEGIHFDKQSLLRNAAQKPILHDETGKRLIPDVIIHYPDEKDVIIDSKVSLSAYSDFCNAEDETQKAVFLKRHIESVRAHYKELQKKDYSNYIKAPRKSLNYMIMFIPNESAMQLALFHDKTLWREAFENGIFITSEQNLLALLRIIQLSWRQVQQARNQQEVFEAARKLLDRISDFIKRFEEVGTRLESARKAYDDCSKKISTGNQSVVKAANEMMKLGVSASVGKELPKVEDDFLVKE
jgi:Uncharacterized protein conserved in bacteria